MDCSDYCLVINNYLEFGSPCSCTESYDEIYLEATNKDDSSIMNVSLEFEEDIKSIKDELKEINLET